MMEIRPTLSMSAGLLWLRILTGAGMTYHGYIKIFGGYMTKFTEGVASMGFPAPEVFAWAAALAEFAGGIFVLAGFQTRMAALFIFTTMCVAVFIRHADDPLGKKELALAYWAMSGALVMTGGGPFAVERFLKRPLGTKS